LTTKLSATGDVKWVTEYIATNNSFLIPEACKVDATNNVYVAGGSEMADYSSVATLVKYAQVTVSVDEEESGVPESYSLSQNFPNPFNPSTAIKFQVPANGLVSVKVYDVLGREVATLVNDELSPGSYSVEWNAVGFASGVYFYRLEAAGFVETKKLLLIK